ncbi:twin-arginine translocase TatA/TatE family subunit [Capnocytophaga sp. oral taxon 878]|uniref:Sec-independent protein translocase subunit TatA/TatB n=1 Tax=Capnocytophaga sp. oral taxon 878 TaxID=1316596 RepID=UPI000D0316A4|nr:twin-arginine translocase TatA/TatE family subunit [Capnocytophaga sp. oral taxon 878]AVM51014.1 Sec-independent protein translocase TatA [Capnocytophaga sp. oral taxon 878]
MGLSEIILILFVVLLLFGADKLPEMARTLGKTIRQIRDATNEIKTEIEQSTHQATDIDTKFITDTQKEIDKLKNDLTK